MADDPIFAKCAWRLIPFITVIFFTNFLGCPMLHRTRHLFVRQQTAVINAIRAHLAEFGIVAPVGRNGVEELLGVVADPSDKRLPEVARACLAVPRRPAADAQGADPQPSYQHSEP